MGRIRLGLEGVHRRLCWHQCLLTTNDACTF